MERLTYKVHDGGIFVKASDVKTFDVEDEIMHTGNAIRKLAEYEDLEEQGLLKIFPCKEGDTVYEIRKYSYCPKGICRSERSCSECRGNAPYKVYKKKFNIKNLSDIGKTVFLTRDEAEDALVEMEKET